MDCDCVCLMVECLFLKRNLNRILEMEVKDGFI